MGAETSSPLTYAARTEIEDLDKFNDATVDTFIKVSQDNPNVSLETFLRAGARFRFLQSTTAEPTPPPRHAYQSYRACLLEPICTKSELTRRFDAVQAAINGRRAEIMVGSSQ